MATSLQKNVLAIDAILHVHNLVRLNEFAFTVGDCLFDSFQVLVHSKYTSHELRTSTIDYFRTCLANNDPEAISSYTNELHIESLIEMHGIDDCTIYLE